MCSMQSIPGNNAPTTITNEHISFLSLPLEIRTQIYSLTLTSSPKIPQEHTLFAPRNRRLLPSRLLSPGLLRANRAINLEASVICYQKNSFLFASPIQGCRWLKRIGRRNRAYIRDLRIIMDSITGEVACLTWCRLFWQLPWKLKNLRRLRLYLDVESMRALKGFERDGKVLEPLSYMPALQYLDVAVPRHAKAWAKHLRHFFRGKVNCVLDTEWCALFTCSIPLIEEA